MFNDWTTDLLYHVVEKLHEDVQRWDNAWDRTYLAIALAEIEMREREEMSHAA